jgi:hypothetical protein
MKRLVALVVFVLLTPFLPVLGRGELLSGSVVRVSVLADGTQANNPSFGVAVSADGSRVAFSSEAALVPGQTDHAVDVYLRDITLGTTLLVSVAPPTGRLGSYNQLLGMDPDGTLVWFTSPGRGARLRVFVHDLGTDTTRQVAKLRSVRTADGSPSSRWTSGAPWSSETSRRGSIAPWRPRRGTSGPSASPTRATWRSTRWMHWSRPITTT